MWNGGLVVDGVARAYISEDGNRLPSRPPDDIALAARDALAGRRRLRLAPSAPVVSELRS